MSAIRIPQCELATAGASTLAETLTTLGQELERIRVLGLRVEQAICAIAVNSALDAALIAELQQLDAVLQHVAALRDFSEQLALECPDAAEVDLSAALERVTLAEVRARLARQSFHDNEESWEIL